MPLVSAGQMPDSHSPPPSTPVPPALPSVDAPPLRGPSDAAPVAWRLLSVSIDSTSSSSSSSSDTPLPTDSPGSLGWTSPSSGDPSNSDVEEPPLPLQQPPSLGVPLPPPLSPPPPSPAPSTTHNGSSAPSSFTGSPTLSPDPPLTIERFGRSHSVPSVDVASVDYDGLPSWVTAPQLPRRASDADLVVYLARPPERWEDFLLPHYGDLDLDHDFLPDLRTPLPWSDAAVRLAGGEMGAGQDEKEREEKAEDDRSSSSDSSASSSSSSEDEEKVEPAPRGRRPPARRRQGGLGGLRPRHLLPMPAPFTVVPAAALRHPRVHRRPSPLLDYYGFALCPMAAGEQPHAPGCWSWPPTPDAAAQHGCERLLLCRVCGAWLLVPPDGRRSAIAMVKNAISRHFCYRIGDEPARREQLVHAVAGIGVPAAVAEADDVDVERQLVDFQGAQVTLRFTVSRRVAAALRALQATGGRFVPIAELEGEDTLALLRELWKLGLLDCQPAQTVARGGRRRDDEDGDEPPTARRRRI